jgi:hypothetical protein
MKFIFIKKTNENVQKVSVNLFRCLQAATAIGSVGAAAASNAGFARNGVIGNDLNQAESRQECIERAVSARWICVCVREKKGGNYAELDCGL